PSGQQATANAVITPTGNAVAGDYVVTLSAKNDQVNQSIQVRTTVETSSVFGYVAIGLIVLVLIGLFLVFRRYGRR
ncbi:MAG: alpha-galactosidase, partial [Chloroflexota bacterium]